MAREESILDAGLRPVNPEAAFSSIRGAYPPHRERRMREDIEALGALFSRDRSRARIGSHARPVSPGQDVQRLFSAGSVSRGAVALDHRRNDPAHEDPGEDEEPDGDHESRSERETREGRQGASAVSRRTPDEEEARRLSSGKAVAAAFLFFGLIVAAAAVFLVVLIQRAC
jgi:hypothetical protein